MTRVKLYDGRGEKCNELSNGTYDDVILVAGVYLVLVLDPDRTAWFIAHRFKENCFYALANPLPVIVVHELSL